MTSRDALNQLLEELPPRRVDEILDYARFLSVQEESDGWRQFGLSQLAKAYGDQEPEYSEADIKKDSGA